MKVLTFGEIMLRLKTPEYLRIVQADGFEASYGGAESNVAVSLASFGDAAAFVTKLPENPVGEAALNELRRYGVDTSLILKGGPRLGIYYFEKGTNIRPTNVVYDRAGSSISVADSSEFDWEKLLFFRCDPGDQRFHRQGCRRGSDLLSGPSHPGSLRFKLPF